MQIDYKRDLNHTYVILQEEKEPDTASYQIRMLLTNAIPGLLDCKIGKMDDKTLFYYEVTSRQSLQSVFEQRSIGAEALRKLFEQLLDLLEELGQYLLAPDGLVLQPELVFADANLENFSFCYLPGKQRHTDCFQKQIRELMEYLLPKLDHQEQDAVVLGYGLYREISAEIFSVEMIQALLYQTGKEKKETTEQEGKERPREENPPVQMEETLWEEQEVEAAENFFVEAEEEKDEGRWKNIVEAVICIGFLGGVLALRWTQAETVWYLVLGGAAAVVGIVSLALELVSRWKKRQSGTETGSYGKAAGIRKQGETGDVFSEYQNRKGLKQKDGTWNPKSDTEQQGWKRDSSVEKEKTWEKNEEQENRKMHSLMELEGHEEDLFGKTELLTSPEDEGRAYLIPIDPIDLPLIPIERGSTLIGKLSTAADVILPYRTVSRLHAKLVSTEEGDYLLDLNSRNGTTVNGVPLMGETKKKLEDGDDISFAGKKYRYKAGEKNRN